MKETTRIRIFSFAITAVVLAQLFQNCSHFGQFEVVDYVSLNMGSGSNPDVNHPAPQSATLPTQRVQVGNKIYVAQLMREIFTSTTNPVPRLEDLIDAWIFNRGGQYGFGCDPYGTHSGRDCGGEVTNSTLPLQADDSTVRESFRLQFCQNVLGTDQGVHAVLEKINLRSVVPTSESVKQAYDLFYRSDEASEHTISILLDLDRSLALQKEPEIERWRALILALCESPDWQIF